MIYQLYIGHFICFIFYFFSFFPYEIKEEIVNKLVESDGVLIILDAQVPENCRHNWGALVSLRNATCSLALIIVPGCVSAVHLHHYQKHNHSSLALYIVEQTS